MRGKSLSFVIGTETQVKAPAHTREQRFEPAADKESVPDFS
jgi:hypothetical protein